MLNNTINFQVVSNLAFTADVAAATEVKYEGVSTKSGQPKPYSFTRFETDLKIGGIKVGKLVSGKYDPRPVLQADGTYKLIRTLKWEASFPKGKEWVSIKEDELVKSGFRKFYEDDQTNQKGDVNHVIGYDKAEGGTYVKLWVYQNQADRTNPNAVRAQIEMKATRFEEVK